MPIELPRRVDTVQNLRAAKAIGLTVPSAILLRADRVTEGAAASIRRNRFVRGTGVVAAGGRAVSRFDYQYEAQDFWEFAHAGKDSTKEALQLRIKNGGRVSQDSNDLHKCLRGIEYEKKHPGLLDRGYLQLRKFNWL